MSTASPAFTERNLRALPAPIVDKLRDLIARVRRIAITKGVFAVIATGLVCLMAIMAIDATLTIFSSAARWSLTLGALAVTVAAAWWWVVRPATKRITLTNIARYVETRHPELQETISSSLELLASDDPNEIRGSEELIGEVVKSAVRDVGQVRTNDEFDTRPIRRAAVAAASFAGILALIFVIWPKPSTTLFARAVAPFLQVGNAYADTLTVEPGDLRVPAGSDVSVEVSIRHKRLNRATVRRRDDENSPEGVERMDLINVDDDYVRTFARTFPNVQKDFQYRVHAGAAVSRFYNVEVVPAPDVEQITIRYDYPEYTKLPPVEGVSETGEIVALENTLVTVTARTTRKMEAANLLIGTESQPRVEATSAEADPRDVSWRFFLKRDQEEDWQIQLKDEYGFENPEIFYPLRSIRDQLPEVTLSAPEARELKLRPTEFLPISYTATEDFGFSAVNLLVKIDENNPAREIEQVLPVKTTADWTGKAPLDLSSLDLERARTVTAQVQVADNLPPHLKGSQKAFSDIIEIRLDRGAKPLAEQIFDAQEKEIRDTLEQAKTDLRQAKSENEGTKRELDREKEQLSPEALKRLDNSRKEMAEAEEKLQALSEKMAQTVFDERAKEIAEITKANLRPARDAAEAIALTDAHEERKAQAENVEDELEEALVEIDEVLKNLRESEKEVEKVAELTELANEQRRLAEDAIQDVQEQSAEEAMKAAEEGSNEAKQQEKERAQDLREWQDQQQQLQRELGEMLREDPEALKAVLEAQNEQAEKLAKRAETLAEEQAQLRTTAEQAVKPETAKALTEEIMQRLREEQQKIAEQAQKIQERMAEKNRPLEQGSDDAKEAARQLQRNNLDRAQKAAKEATENFGQVAEQAQRAQAKESLRKIAQEALQQATLQRTGREPDEAMQKAIEQAAEEAAAQVANSPQPIREDQMRQAVNEAAEKMAKAQAENREATPPQISQAAQETFQAKAKQAMRQAAKEAMQRAAAESGQPPTPQMREAMERAAESASQALAGEPLSPEQFEQLMKAAAEKMTQAGENANTEQMAQAADEMFENAAAETGKQREQNQPVPEMAAQLENLAQRQEAVAQVLDSIRSGQLEDALAAMQEAVSAESQALVQEAQGLEEAARAAQQNQAQNQANQAESSFRRAEQQAKAASEQLARAQQSQDQAQAQAAQQAAKEAGKPISSGEAMAQAQQGDVAPQPANSSEQSALRSSNSAQQQSQQALEQAARQLSQAAEQFQNRANALSPSQDQDPSPLMESQDLAQSFDRVSQAAQAQDATQAASQAMAAAQSLQQMAQQAAENMGAMGPSMTQTPQNTPQQGEPSLATNSQSLNEQGKIGPAVDASGVPPELAKLGISVEDWARFQGTLRNDITNQGAAGAPEEYQSLVNQYFRIIAKEARTSK